VATDFGVTTRADGTQQTTYKGWPLYYNVNDVNAGDVKGDGVGSLWAVAKASYTVMFANAQLVSLEGANYSSLGVVGTGASQYLTDGKGRTLYINTADTFNQNHFTNTDPNHNNLWPFVPTTGVDDIPSVFDKTQFGVIATVTGGQQLTYKGRPLYYFGQDNATKGNTKGISFPTPGAAIWRVANTATVPLQ
jgi:predicted lipoprotein with Yx(FWY)xxD motif